MGNRIYVVLEGQADCMILMVIESGPLCDHLCYLSVLRHRRPQTHPTIIIAPPLSSSNLDCRRLELNLWTPQVRHIPHDPDLRRLRLSQIPLLLLRIPTVYFFHSHPSIVRLPTPFSIKLPHSLVS